MKYKQNWKADYWPYLHVSLQQSPSIALNDSISKVLERSKNAAQLNAALTLANERAYSLARKWAIWGIATYGEHMPPYIAIPGDGSLVIEWETDSGTVSVRFDAEDEDTDIIISRIDGVRLVKQFTPYALRMSLNQLISQNATLSLYSNINYSEASVGDYSSHWDKPNSNLRRRQIQREFATA